MKDDYIMPGGQTITRCSNPLWYTVEEGGNWLKWVPEKGAIQGMYSIMFEDGTIFDYRNGWRKQQYCPKCWRPL